MDWKLTFGKGPNRSDCSDDVDLGIVLLVF